MEFNGEYNLDTIIGIAGFIGSLFSAYWWKYNNVKTKLQESHYRYEHTLLLQKSSFETKYKSSLSSLIKWVEQLYTNSTRLHNYSRHITIALLYSFMIFLLFWVLGASGSIGSIAVLKDDITIGQKLVTFFFFVIYILLIYILLKYLPKWTNYLLKKLPFKVENNQFLKILIITFIVISTVGGVVRSRRSRNRSSRSRSRSSRA
jgi:hypothetical protein